MAENTRHIAVVGVGGASQDVAVACADTVASLAWRLHQSRAPGAKCPQLVFDNSVLPWDISVAEAGIEDGAELRVVWPVSGKDPNVRACGADPGLALDQAGLGMILRSAVAEINLAGYRLRVDAQLVLSHRVVDLTKTLTVLDVSGCQLTEGVMVPLFSALPATVTHLRARGNGCGLHALQALATRSCCFKVLDVSDQWEGEDDDLLAVDEACMKALVGPELEELGVASLYGMSSHLLIQLVAVCHGLRKLNVGCCRDFEEHASAAWSEVARCSNMEEIRAEGCDCPARSMVALASGCPHLRVLIVGCCAGLDKELAAIGALSLDVLVIEAPTVEDMVAATQLQVGWLSLRSIEEEDQGSIWAAGELLASALAATSASDIELSLSDGITPSVLRAAGSRLRSIRSESQGGGLRDGAAVLPALSDAMVGHACLNLLRLDVNFWELVTSQHLETIAATCPLLETVRLNADSCDFQSAAIDNGIRALGKHCRRLVHLDLYDRPLERAAEVLAEACAGWPLLLYLCAANCSTPSWGASPDQECLPRALAANCPMLESLVLYMVPASWRSILEAGCPKLDPSVFGSDTEAGEFEDGVSEPDA